MPVSSISSYSVPLPASGRGLALRAIAGGLEGPEQRADDSLTVGQQIIDDVSDISEDFVSNRHASGDVIAVANENAVLSVVDSEADTVLFQSTPSFDGFPPAQREALQLYLANQTLSEEIIDARQSIVGIDIFI